MKYVRGYARLICLKNEIESPSSALSPVLFLSSLYLWSYRDIEYVEISEDKDIQLKMLFDPKTNLEERIINEQFIY